MVQNKKV